MTHRENIDQMPLQDLNKLLKEIDKKIAKREDLDYRFLNGLRRMIYHKYGKYATHNNSLEVWCGQGRRPKWFREYIAAGGDAKDLLI